MASGKSTFARALAEKLNFTLFEERFEDNPYLELYYEDPVKWAFHNELWFIRKKADQHDEIARHPSGCVQDSPIIMIPAFLDSMKRENSMKFDDYIDCLQCYYAVVRTLKLPDFLIKIDIDEDLALSRLKQRSRSMEQEVDVSYLRSCIESLNNMEIDIPNMVIDAGNSVEDNVELVTRSLSLRLK